MYQAHGVGAHSLGMQLIAVLCAGDDPNYWIVAACKAEAEYQKKAVQKMLSQLRGEVNTSKKKVRQAGRLQACISTA